MFGMDLNVILKNITSRNTFKNTIKEHFLQISSN
jgi:hypothetical protein